jgi:acyl dehydratase
MPVVYEKLLALKIPDVEASYGPKDCMLYALGVGLGLDPTDEQQLAFVYEKHLKALPTMAVVIGYPGFWAKELDTGIDWVKVVAGEHSLVLHKPLAPAGTVTSRTRVLDIVDKGAGKGAGKGAIIYSERTIDDKATGERIATIVQTTFCRGDGGFGGPPRETRPAHPIPERAPDLVCDLPTRPEMALIYRLSADPNPLHAEPAVAKAAGFPRRSCTGSRPSGSRATPSSRPCAAMTRDSSPPLPAASRLRCFPARPSAPRFGATARS